MSKYDFPTWTERHELRSDLTLRLTHLTREAIVDGQGLSAVAVLVKILKEGRIIGSTTQSGFIVGRRPAVCFHAAPLLGLSENIRYEKGEERTGAKVRYRGVGLVFHKFYAFERGARPVLYEKTEVAKAMLPVTEHWRIVDLDLVDKDNVVDWTHEREWRMPGDFVFERNAASVIVASTNDYQQFLDLAGAVLVREVMGITVLRHAIG